MIEYKKSMYKKIFITYTSVIIAIVIILSSFFYASILSEVRSNAIYINKKITEDTSSYLKGMKRTNDYVRRYLYQSNSELADMINFLEKDWNSYLENRLDEYSKNNRSTYNGMDYFISKVYEVSDNILEIAAYSYKQDKYTEFYRNGRNKSYVLKNNQKTYNTQIIDKSKKGLTLIETIKHPMTFERLGEIMITYDLAPIESFIGNNTNHRIRLLNHENIVLYDSAGVLEGQFYPYISNQVINQKELEDASDCYVNIAYIEKGLIVIGEIDKEDAEHIPTIIQLSLVLLSIILFSIGELIVYMRLRHLDNRMKKLLNAMSEVTQGNLEVAIEEEGIYDDELNLIITGFNNMCRELNDYIQKSYLAEINQKNAEMRALQSQINPHFLYNTLESIRMKAICNGDREVGKMLYNLAIIFRSQIKEANEIPLAKELHYCKKYLELFSFRYENNFQFDIICDEMYLSKSVIKFMIQPIIENYFVHGIRLEDADNYIRVEVTEGEECLQINVQDNGCGASDEKIEELNEMLRKCKYDGKSMGIVNVHERIVMTYGREYGVEIMKNSQQGLKIVLKIPNREGVQYV